MSIDYKEVESQAGLIDLIDPGLGNRLHQLLSELRTKNITYNNSSNNLKGWPTHEMLATDLEVTVTEILAFFGAYKYVPCNMSSGMWGKWYVLVHPLYVQAFYEKWHPLLGWESSMGNVPEWAAVVIRPPLVDRIMWDEE